MGLAAPKDRIKMSKDPNNNAWGRSTTRFGHRLLVAQGWRPGQTLGNTEAAYAAHYTAGSASHVRVLLKDDCLGLGATRGKADGEGFGLDLLSGLLGRLNGKSDDQLRKEEGARRDVRLREYVGQRSKSMGFGFVSGGFLVGDKIEASVERGEETDVAVVCPKTLRKRKRAEPEDIPSSGTTQFTDPKPKSSRSKLAAADNTASEATDDEEDDSETAAKRKRKQEKRARKESRQAEREAKDARKDSRRLKREAKQSKLESPEDSGITVSPTPSLNAGRGRNVIRQRYIQQKRMACMDQQALNEIFMIKSKS